jgi:tetratricopeptide (TPR) repeat protein
VNALLAIFALAQAGDCREVTEALDRGRAELVRVEEFGRAGECFVALGNAEPAAAMFERGLARYPNSMPLLKSYGALLLRWKPKAAAAAKIFERLRALGARDAEANYFYGQWALLTNREAQAVAALSRAIRLAPRNDLALAQNYTLIGMAEEQRNRPEAAGQAYREAFAANRRLPSLQLAPAQRYADFLDREGRAEEAKEIAETILAVNPRWPGALFLRAKAQARPAPTPAAAASGESALLHVGGDLALERAIRAFLIRTYYSLGQKERAEEHRKWIDSQ